MSIVAKGLTIALIVIPVVLISRDLADPQVCAEEAKVKAILSVDYRDATILLEDGRELRVNQSTVKPGQMYCLHKDYRSHVAKKQGQ